MEVLFLEAPYAGEVKLCHETLKYLKKKKYKTVALYASIQFVHNLDLVRKQLQAEKISVITSHAKRTHVSGQLLGCDVFHDSLNLKKEIVPKIDAYLYIGDGKFHPYALAYTQKESEEFKEIICNDPVHKSMTLVDQKEIQTILGRYKASLVKFLSSRTIGVISTIKPGQEYLKQSFMLEKHYPDKKFFYFIDDTLSFNQLENFPFIEVWINTACPRIGIDDQKQFQKGVINLSDALRASEILSTMGTTGRR